MSAQGAKNEAKRNEGLQRPTILIDGLTIAYPYRAITDCLPVIRTEISAEESQLSGVIDIYLDDRPGTGRLNVRYLTQLTHNQRSFLTGEITRLRRRPIRTVPDNEDEPQAITIAQVGAITERDARGRILSAYVPNPFIIDELLSRGIIDREQHWHAEMFVAMRRVFLRPVATIRTITPYQSDNEGRPPAKYPIADNDYLIVLRDMRHGWQQRIVEAAVDDDFSPNALAMLLDIQEQNVSNAFWGLTYAINRLLDKKKEAEDTKKDVARTENPRLT